MEPIGFATLYMQPRKLSGLENVSDIWLADALTNEGDVRLYLKRATHEEIMAECLCALLAQKLDLPVARTFIVRDTPGFITGGYFVGSEDEGSPSIRQRVLNGETLVLEALKKWERLHEVALFDEWVANPDRNTGNLLWGGGDDWCLIDHAYALCSGSERFDESVERRNIMAEIIRQLEGYDIGPARLRKLAGPFAAKCRAVDSEKIQNASHCEHIGMYQRAQSTLSSLQSRLAIMPNLVARHGTQLEML